MDPATVPDASLTAVVQAVRLGAELVTFKAYQPSRIARRGRISGLTAGESPGGIDYRLARGELSAISELDGLCRLDPGKGKLAELPPGKRAALPPGGAGFDVNPVADRIFFVAATAPACASVRIPAPWRRPKTPPSTSRTSTTRRWPPFHAAVAGVCRSSIWPADGLGTPGRSRTAARSGA